MATIACYSVKGGTGKTSLAVNLAWSSAASSGRRTLLWDLDAQGAASFILAAPAGRHAARDVIGRDLPPERLIVPTGIANLDLLPADASLRALDVVFSELGAKQRLRRIAGELDRHYDRIIVDCPPGLGVTAGQIVRGADLIVEPVIPSALSLRAGEELRAYLADRRKAAPPVLRVFNMVDRRRAAHRAALANEPETAAVPMSSLIEQMSARNMPLGAYAAASPPARAIAGLWIAVERRLATAKSRRDG